MNQRLECGLVLYEELATAQHGLAYLVVEEIKLGVRGIIDIPELIGSALDLKLVNILLN
jgi:hypothetical protein